MVSIIVPVYNVGAFVSECLQSIVAQSYNDFECILIDDGSSDESGQICDEIACTDGRFRVFHKKNEGVSAARNCGLNLVKGDYVTFIDSDDYISKDYLSELVRQMSSDVDLVVSGYNIYGNADVSKSYVYDDVVFSINDENTDALVSLSNKYLLYGPCAKLYKTAIIKNNNINFNVEMSLGEDLHFNCDYLRHVNRIANICQANYYYRNISSQTLSKKKRSDYFEICYKEWHTLRKFYSDKAVWNDVSKVYLYKLLWGFVYDGIFYVQERERVSYDYYKCILSIEEIYYLRDYKEVYHCSSWIKYAILHRMAWVFFLYFKLFTKK